MPCTQKFFRKSLLLAGALACLGAMAPVATVQATVITLDDVNTTSGGVDVSTRYAASTGITLGCINGTDATRNQCGGSKAYAVASPLAQSPRNVISLTATLSGAATDEQTGYFTARFATPMAYASVDARSLVLPNDHYGGKHITPYMNAYNAAGQWLATATYDLDVDLGLWHTLEINRTAGDISMIVFSSAYDAAAGGIHVFGVFDNIDPLSAPQAAFDFARDSATVNPTPEPASLALIMLALGGLALQRRRRR